MKWKILALLPLTLALGGCPNDANVVSQNISQAADNFQINRRVVFYNGITNDYILVIEGLCSINFDGKKIGVTCKTGVADYKKHYLLASDNVTIFSEQIDAAKASTYFYRVTFKPSVILPAVDVR